MAGQGERQGQLQVWLRHLVWQSGTISCWLMVFAFSMSLLPYVCAYIEGNLFMKGDAVGLLEHHGIISMTAVFPFLLLMSSRGLRNYRKFADESAVYVSRARFETKHSIGDFSGRNSIDIPVPGLLVGAVVVGFLLFLYNCLNTIDPVQVYGHDVYDSIQHPLGYAGTRAFFLFWWSYALPVLCYRALAVIHYLKKFFAAVRETGALELQPLHPDGAGGLGVLGTMGLWFNLAVLITLVPTLGLYLTHRFTLPLIAGMIVQFIMLPVVFLLPVYPAHLAMSEHKRTILLHLSIKQKELNDRLFALLLSREEAFFDDIGSIAEHQDKISAVLDTIRNLPTWPFNVLTITKAMTSSLVPLVLAAIKLLTTLV